MIDDLACLIKSTTNNEVILHAPQQFDLRIFCDRRDAFLDLLKLMFAKMQPKVTLKIYGVVSRYAFIVSSLRKTLRSIMPLLQVRSMDLITCHRMR